MPLQPAGAAREKLGKRLVDNQASEEPNRYDDGLWSPVVTSQTSQLAGMRGLMAAPNGRDHGLPILSNLRRSVSTLKCLSTHGARKGMRPIRF